MATQKRNVGSADIAVIGSFDQEQLRSFYDSFMEIMQDPPGNLNIYISSGGGDSVVCNAMIDLIRLAKASGVHVTTIAIGECQSSGAYLFLIGDDRLISPSCLFMFHKGTFTPTEAMTEESVIALAQTTIKLEKVALELICDSSGVSVEEVEEMVRGNGETYITAEDAVAKGLATAIFLA